MHKNRLHLLYFTAEQWPTFRQDVVALFGKYLPRHGITCDLVTERDIAIEDTPKTPWGGGQALLCNVPRNRAGQYLVKFWHNLRVLITMDAEKYDAIQVRDMSVTAFVGLVIARLKGVRFYYWLSYPQSEGQIYRAKARGIKAGIYFWFPLIQGLLGTWLLYRIVLPRVDHVFVQSRQMQLDLAARYGIPMTHMTPVPMGVDIETTRPEIILPTNDSRLAGKRVLAYLGTLDRARQIEILFEMLAHIRQQIPNILLVLVGDTEDATHLDWLKQEAARIGVAEQVLWTGWLPSSRAWGYVRMAEIGLSPFPRNYLLDSASPTKALEYMALGLPVVANDNPDQAKVIGESGGGLCVNLESRTFAESVIRLLSDEVLRQKMGDAGRQYVASTRAYDNLACTVATKYQALLSGKQSSGNTK
jgi:glycosyltransferase involved in cell wall biosynthesis